MKFKIFNNSGLDQSFEDMLQNLTVFAQNRFGFKKPPTFHLNSDVENAQHTLGKTGYYDPSAMEIHVYVDGRHNKDILRSVAHEIVHHWQNERGDLNSQESECAHPDWEPACVKNNYHGPGYAQKNPHLRNMEKEAYLKGNMCFRDWEDSYKATNYNQRGNTMSLKEWKNQQLNERLMKKWFGVTLKEGVAQENPEEKDAHYKGAAEDDWEQIAKLKKDAHYDAEKRKDAEKDLEEGNMSPQAAMQKHKEFDKKMDNPELAKKGSKRSSKPGAPGSPEWEAKHDLEEAGHAYKRDKNWGGNRGDDPAPDSKKGKEAAAFGGGRKSGVKDYEPVIEEDEDIQEASGDRGDDDREQGRDAGRTFRADSGGNLEEKVFQAVMKILKGK